MDIIKINEGLYTRKDKLMVVKAQSSSEESVLWDVYETLTTVKIGAGTTKENAVLRAVEHETNSLDYPPCFLDLGNYLEWKLLAFVQDGYPPAHIVQALPLHKLRSEKSRIRRRLTRDKTYCLDCTPEYQQKMLWERKCTNPKFLKKEG